ncbi:MAG: SLBB domain-containing protein [Verrucomicrobiota bacterium]|nr:SLBB domain-containing protein [Verrucomicrobiota bacterium]
MKRFVAKLILLIIFICVPFLHAQLDPALISKHSKLSSDQRHQLLKQYGPDTNSLPQSSPTVDLPNRLIKVEKPKEESFEDRTDFLLDLNSMERMISADVNRLEGQLDEEGSTHDNELLESLEESKALLRKIKQLQRREIEKRAEEFGKSETDAIKPFGYDLFASDPSTFAPGNEVPIPTDYRIGPGDLLDIQLFGQRNESFSLVISREGMIRFPGIGPINAFEKGTSFIELKNHLKEKILKQLGEGVQTSISLGAFRSIRIFLLGEVRKQGAYTVSALSTTINALLSCGGIKETGSLRKIQLKRAGNLVATLDLYDLLLEGDTSEDQALQPGDVIFVPVVEKQVTISGAVKRPAKYEILGGETLSQVVDIAGGTDARSALDLIRLERLNSDYRNVVKNLNFSENKDFKIASGDLISIGFAGSSVKNVVSIIGAVEKVGDYEWRENLKLTDIISSKDDFLTNTDLNYGIIRRMNQDGTYSCFGFKPIDLVSSTTEPVGLELMDLIYFFSKDKESREDLLEGLISDLRNQATSGSFAKTVQITGSTHFPGAYPLTESMSIIDLISAGGGTKDSTYMIDAEITRIHIDSEQVAFVEHIRIDQKGLTESNTSKQVKLQPYDVLSLKPIPLWREGESIELKGEFRFPGIYSIKSAETIIDIIDRAGGLTERAFPQGAIFSRENLREREDEQKERLIAQLESDLASVTLSASDQAEAAQAQSAANSILLRLRSTESQGRLVIDLEKLLNTDEEFNLLVKNGDQLFVPQIPYSVSVSGEVQFPTSHLHQDNLDMNDYLRRSGGFTQNADEDRTFVVKANGAVLTKGGNAWFRKGNGNQGIDAGDVIVVPIDVKQTRFLENLSYSTQIIYQLAVAAAAVNSF